MSILTLKRSLLNGGVHIRQEIPSGEVGEPILVSPGNTATLIPDSGGSGKVQFTTSHPDEIALNKATWLDSEAGDINEPTSIRCDNVIAIRALSITQDIILEVIQ